MSLGIHEETIFHLVGVLVNIDLVELRRIVGNSADEAFVFGAWVGEVIPQEGIAIIERLVWKIVLLCLAILGYV